MAAQLKGKYYVRMDIGDLFDVFSTESFVSYRIAMKAGGTLPMLVVEFSARGLLADQLKGELREDTPIKFYEGFDRDTATISDWTATTPGFRNNNDDTEFRVECLLATQGYDSQNLTESITGTSIDVMVQMAERYLGKKTVFDAAPRDSMTWALGLSVPQEAMVKAQIRYWGADSPDTALTFGVPDRGPVIIKDLKRAIQKGPDWEILYDLEPTTDLPVIRVRSDYTVYPHNSLLSRAAGVNRIAGSTTVNPQGEVFAEIDRFDDLDSPFAGSRIESSPTYDASLPGRIDWSNLFDEENVHENWVRARNVNIIQLTRAMDVEIKLLANENLQDVKLLDVVLFKEQTYDRQLLDTFSGLYFVTGIERVFDTASHSVSTLITINKDGA